MNLHMQCELAECFGNMILVFKLTKNNILLKYLEGIFINALYRVSSGQGKVREIPDSAKVREKSGNFVEGQGKNDYWEKSGKSQGICI